MARNCEKHFVGLNRVYLNKQWEKEKELKRPHLDTLTTAADVRKWIPNIKEELDYYLRQLSGARKHEYPPAKLNEFEKKVKHLELTHKMFVKKVLELDKSQVGIPWELKGYVKRKSSTSEKLDEKPEKEPKKKKIVLNILNEEAVPDDSSCSTDPCSSTT